MLYIIWMILNALGQIFRNIRVNRLPGSNYMIHNYIILFNIKIYHIILYKICLEFTGEGDEVFDAESFGAKVEDRVGEEVREGFR